MKSLEKWISAIHLFIGTGAIMGGTAALLNPVSPLGMSVEMMKKGPFTSFLIPGLILLLLPGAGNFVAAFIMYKKAQARGIISGTMGIVIVFWIVIQCFILESVGFLHALYFLLGTVQGLMAIAFVSRENMFRLNLVNKIVNGKSNLI